MKNRMAQLIGASFGLSLEAAEGGGGTAVATPVASGSEGAGGAGAGAGATPAGGSGAGSAKAGGDTFSFFRNVAPREDGTSATDKGGATSSGDKKFIVSDDNGQPIEGAAFATQEEAEAYVKEHGNGTATDGATATEKTPEEIAAEELAIQTGSAEKGGAGSAEIAPDAALKTPIYGRFKTIKEAEAGIQRMEREGVRLSSENKKLKADAEKAIATREAELASTKAELEMARKTPPFKELTKEEYDKLAKEDPGQAVDYRLAKRDHEQSIQRAKDDAARGVHQRQQKIEAAKAEIERVVVEMDKDSKSYPMFRDVDPMMGDIYRSLGGDESPLRGDPRAVPLFYHAAMGKLYIALLQKGKVAVADANKNAKDTAAAAAKATAGTAAGAGSASPKTKTKAQLDHEAWSKSIKEAAPGRVLNLVD